LNKRLLLHLKHGKKNLRKQNQTIIVTKRVATTLLAKYVKSHLHACKHKYRPNNNKKTTQGVHMDSTFRLEKYTFKFLE
jgi:hypothetical protein